RAQARRAHAGRSRRGKRGKRRLALLVHGTLRAFHRDRTDVPACRTVRAQRTACARRRRQCHQSQAPCDPARAMRHASRALELRRRVNADEDLKLTRLVLLTSSGLRGDALRFAQIGFAGYLLKPVAESDLIDCLLVVLGGDAKDWHSQTQPIVTRHELRVLRNRSDRKRLLLAEDVPVNQKVACHALEKLGYEVDVVSNGREAVAAWETGKYDLILMDCQMPEM